MQQSVPNCKPQTSKSEVNWAQTKSHSSPASMMNMLVDKNKICSIRILKLKQRIYCFI